MGKLEGKVAIITGSSSGIGQATAIKFAKAGASVTVHGRSEESLQKTHKKLLSKNVPDNKILIVKGVIEDDQTCRELIKKTVDKFGRIDVLVNNAGMRSKPGVDYLSMENFQYVFDVNLKSAVLLTQLAIPYLEKTKGNIVNISSGLSIKPTHLSPFYCMAKAALDHFGRCYSLILADKGIRVNTVNPGLIKTEFAVKGGLAPELVEKFHEAAANSMIPMKRSGSADEIAKTIFFLATDATYMTGANIVADGGFVLFAPTPKMD